MPSNGLKKLTIAGNPACGYVLVWQDANGTRTCTRQPYGCRDGARAYCSPRGRVYD